MTIGERIKELRNQRNMTLEEVGNYLNIARATVHKYECGKITNIPHDKILQLAQLFNVSPAYIAGWSERTELSPYIPQTSEATIIAKGIDRMSEMQRQQALNVIRAMFEQYNYFF